jgi:hypothetical protein
VRLRTKAFPGKVLRGFPVRKRDQTKLGTLLVSLKREAV